MGKGGVGRSGRGRRSAISHSRVFDVHMSLVHLQRRITNIGYWRSCVGTRAALLPECHAPLALLHMHFAKSVHHSHDNRREPALYKRSPSAGPETNRTMGRLKPTHAAISSSRVVLVLLGLIFGAQLIIIARYKAPCPAVEMAAALQDVSVPPIVSLAAASPVVDPFPPASPSPPASSVDAKSSSVDLVDPPLPRLPAPLIVACLANMRTVSTTAYNLARVLMERVDPNSVSGWEKDVTGTKADILTRDVVPKARGLVSMVYKSHIADQDYHESANFFLVTYRDPYDMVCSMAKMFRPVFFTDFSKALHSCHTMAQNERRIHELAEAAGPGYALHVHYSALHTIEGMTEVAEKMAQMWKVEGGVVDARGVAREVLELQAPPPGIFPVAHPRSELHANHITQSNSTKQDCAPMRKALEADERCRAWHARYERLFPPGTTELVRDSLGRRR